MKKLLIALGLGSALIITPVLAQTDQTAPAAGAAAPADASKDTMKAKPKPKHHHKAKKQRYAHDAMCFVLMCIMMGHIFAR